MKSHMLFGLLLLPLLGALAQAGHAEEELLSESDLQQAFAGKTGRHWSIDDQKWYVITWNTDNTLVVTSVTSNPHPETVQTGTWTIEEENLEDPEKPMHRNAVYCQTFEKWHGGKKLCFDIYQVTFGEDDSEIGYKYYRESAAETGEFMVSK